MSVDSTKLVIPGHGTVFWGAPGLKPPADPLSTFSLTGTPPAGWTNLGHTSADNTIALSKDGGEKESIDTFLADAVRVVYSAAAWSVTIPALQFDADVLDLAFNGDFDATTGGYIVPGQVAPTEAALFLYFQDNSGALGFWIPNTSVTLGEPPSVDKAAFMELPLAAAIKSADESVIPGVNGRPGIMEVFKTGLVLGAPRVSAAAPAAAAAGALLTVTGSGFTGVTGPAGVKLGGTNATSYTVVSDNTIVATMPAGAAGPAPITVTHPTGGTSAAFPYSRGA